MLEDEEVIGDRSPKEEVLINEFVRSSTLKNYDVTNLGTYVIYDEDQVIPQVTKKQEAQYESLSDE